MDWQQQGWVVGVVVALVIAAAGLIRYSEGPTEEAAAAALRIEIDVSERRLAVYEGGDRIRSFPIAVGKSSHPTPRGGYTINRVVWNPWWHPPPGRAWTRGKGPTPPGPGNPMGRVKLYFRPLYYIHGTPNEGSIGRAVSHGCVRLTNQNAIELARLVHRYGSPDVSGADIDWLVANPKETRTIRLARPVPVKIV